MSSRVLFEHDLGVGRHVDLELLPGLSIDTRYEIRDVVLSTPIGEICVTRPLNSLSLNVSTLMRAD
jgi:hypothetical protein